MRPILVHGGGKAINKGVRPAVPSEVSANASGRIVALPVINEETQRSESVALFALRVPQAEYEKVKADKLDNGLIDEAVVGEKRRGELDVDYRVAVAGGAITEW